MRSPSNLLGKSTTTACCSKVGIKRGPWTPEEDEVLSNFIKREGEGRWRTLPKRAGLLRCGKSCRLRWMNYLRPSVKRGRIAPDEEDLILRLHRLLGNRWSLIAGRIPGRTDNEIKNYWNTHLSKKLISQGIDPRTHKPLINHLITNTPTHTSSSNPNPPIIFSNSSELGEKNSNKNIIQDDLTPAPEPNLELYPQQHCQNQQVANWHNSDESSTNFIMEQHASGQGINGGGGYLENCINEDTMFSSFLDCLINDNLFVNQQQPPQPQPNNKDNNNVVASSSAPTNFSHAGNNIWEAEIVSSMLDFGNELNSAANINHQQQYQP